MVPPDATIALYGNVWAFVTVVLSGGGSGGGATSQAFEAEQLTVPEIVAC
jgi:hypothetical protein